MSNLQISTFNFENSSIRVISINNEPWFLSVDVCNALNIKNSRDAIRNLDEDEYQILNLKDTVGLTYGIANQVQSVGMVSESGMYTLILRCRNAVKKGSTPHRFRKWVTAEVLPQIRKTGTYQAQLPLAHKTRPEKVYVFEFTENEIRELAWLSYSHKQMNELLGFLFKPLHTLGSAYSGKAYSHHYEYKKHHTRTLPTIKRLIAPFKQLDNFDWQHTIHLLNE